jgi:hypothetical protein
MAGQAALRHWRHRTRLSTACGPNVTAFVIRRLIARSPLTELGGNPDGSHVNPAAESRCVQEGSPAYVFPYLSDSRLHATSPDKDEDRGDAAARGRWRPRA